jgi:hypothetical protein
MRKMLRPALPKVNDAGNVTRQTGALVDDSDLRARNDRTRCLSGASGDLCRLTKSHLLKCQNQQHQCDDANKELVLH